MTIEQRGARARADVRNRSLAVAPLSSGRSVQARNLGALPIFLDSPMAIRYRHLPDT